MGGHVLYRLFVIAYINSLIVSINRTELYFHNI